MFAKRRNSLKRGGVGKGTRWGRAALEACLEPLEERRLLTTNYGTVTSSADSGSNTLRYWMAQANSTGGDWVINTNFTTPTTIDLTSSLELNDSTGTVEIDGPGANLLTIDAGTHSRAILVDSNATGDIENLTITNGSTGENGGGIDNNGNLIISNVAVTGNSAFYGGGIYSGSDSYLTITDSTINDNMASGGGGGISTYSASQVSITSSTISGNSASGFLGGGGLYMFLGTLAISNSTISYNTSAYYAGGIFDESNSSTITSSVISDNQAGGNAGGIGGGTLEDLVDCTIEGNTAAGNAGGISCFTSVTLEGCTVDDNSAGNSGGGIVPWDNFYLINSTVTGNTAQTNGGGIYNYDQIGRDYITDSTISGNTANIGGGIYDQRGGYLDDSMAEGSTLSSSRLAGLKFSSASERATSEFSLDDEDTAEFTLSGTIVANNTGQDLAGDDSALFTGTYNLIDDSSIDDLSGSNNISDNPDLSPLGYYGGPTETMAPLSDSPAIGAGSTFDGPDDEAISTDQRGMSRPGAGSEYDIGAFQTQTNALEVNTTEDDPVGSGLLSLRDATNLASAWGGDQTITFDPSVFTYNGATIDLNGSPLELDDTDSTLTVDGPGAALLTIDAQGLSRVIVNGYSSNAVIEGLTITGGYGTPETGHDYDDISTFGGGIFNWGTLAISNSVITGNSADLGGGIYDYEYASVTIVDSTISGNSTNGYGGGIWNDGGTVTISDSTIYDNSAIYAGGGIICRPGGTVTITNSTIADNAADDAGGAIWSSGGALSVTDSTISGNTATRGGGISIQDEAYAELEGTIVSGNTNGDLAETSSGEFSGTYNLIGDDSGDGILTDASNQLNKDPELGSLAYNGGPTETMALLSGSPAIGMGSSFSVATDQRGFARFGGFDIGAYQSSPMQVFNDTYITGYDFSGIGVPGMVVEGGYDGLSLLNEYGEPSEEAAKGLAAEAAAGSGYLCFDLEPVEGNNEAAIQLVEWAKEVDPNLKVGFYNDLDDTTPFANLYGETSSLIYVHDPDLSLMGMASGTYNEAEDVYRVCDFVTTWDYPREEASWPTEHIAEYETQDGQSYAESKPIYAFVSSDYIGTSTMDPNDETAILAQRSLDCNGVILWSPNPATYTYTDWFNGLTSFVSQNPSSVTAPSLSVDASTMTLSWTDSDTNVMGFEIYRSVHGDDDWVKVGYAPADATTTVTWNDQHLQEDITEEGMPADSTFDYMVRAITGISDVFSNSNIVDGGGSGIAPAWDGYSSNSAIGWDGGLGYSDGAGFINFDRPASGPPLVRGPDTNSGWLEYDNVDFSSGATSLNLNLVYFYGSPNVAIDVYYGGAPGDGGTQVGAFDLDMDYTTGATGFSNASPSELSQITITLYHDIPSNTNSNIYIQFVSASGTPNQYVWLSSWQFVA